MKHEPKLKQTKFKTIATKSENMKCLKSDWSSLSGNLS